MCDDGNTVDGDGCSADCGSLDGVFLVTPPVVSFMATEGDAAPPPIAVRVRLEYRGDTVLAGYATGVPQPTWLLIADRQSSATTAEFELRATDTSVAGVHSTSVRLLLSHQNSTGLKTFDLPVVYSIAPSDLAIQTTPTTLAFTASTGDAVVASQAVTVTSNGVDTAVVSAPSWAKVSAPTPAATPASFDVSISDTSFPAGTVLSGDVVFRTTRGATQRTASVHLTYNVLAPPDLELDAAPPALAFTAFSGGAAPPSQSIDVGFTGEGLTIIAKPSWITMSPPNAETSPAAFAVSINNTSFAGGTHQSGIILFSTTRGAQQLNLAVQIEYDILATPKIEFVAPYIGIAGQPGTLRLRGHNFKARSGLVTIGLGDLRIGPLVPDGDTQITVSYPALSEGRYPVILLDPPGIAPTSLELVIITPPAFTYQAVDAPSRRTRILFDAERQAIYGVNRLDQEMEHFAYLNGTWSVRPPHVVPQLSDIAMAPDGRSLVVLDRNAVNEMSLTDGLFTPVRYADNRDTFCEPLNQAIPADNGRVIIFSSCAFSHWQIYNLQTHSITFDPFVFHLNNGLAAGSADGSRIYVGASNFSSDPIHIVESLSNTVSSGLGRMVLTAISISGNASRVILQNSNVHSRSLTLLGKLPPNGVALASRDSSRAFVYVDNDAGARIEVYNLNGPLQPGALYPLLKTVNLLDSANALGELHPAVVMTSSLDDTTVFVSGDSKLLVVPVN
jgi:hypothetical protein